MTAPFPKWAEIPINIDQAAACLGISVRTLYDKLELHPFYENRGTDKRRKRVFYREHIDALRDALNKEGAEACRSGSKKTASGSTKPAAPSKRRSARKPSDVAFEEALDIVRSAKRSGARTQ